ncbi:MAG TPA: glycosyltransferase family 2 protein [Clostridiaceae bacterium]|nr:glycosyltransferase family 2 protein [Clostridiaceae bacterium]
MKLLKITLIIPCFNESGILSKTICTLEQIMHEVADYSLLFVDDGSTDDSWELLTKAGQQNPKISAIRLSRNYGKEAALCAGLEQAEGDAVIILDSDLQHPPELIPEMINLWKQGYDVVEGVKKSRGKESLFSKLSAKIFYGLFKKFSGNSLDNASDFKLLDRKVVLAWRQFKERDTFFRGLSAWMGFKRIVIPFVVQDREGGESKWSFRKLLRLSISAITGFSAKPLLIVPLLTFILSIFFLVLAVQTLINWCSGRAVEGFTTVILLVLLIGSAIMISLSMIALYIANIFNEIKGRPRYLVSEQLNLPDKEQ